MQLTLNDWPILIVAALVAIVGVGRLSRIITYDDYPPAMWWRRTWAKITNDGPWMKLFTCSWCFTPWLMLVCLGWAAVGYLVLWVAIVWWVFWGWLALAYLASILIAYDQPE